MFTPKEQNVCKLYIFGFNVPLMHNVLTLLTLTNINKDL